MVTDYTSLQQAIADWLARADLAGQIPTFIDLAEARMSRDLRVAAMQASVSGTVTNSNTIALPADCRAVQSLQIAYGTGWREVHPLPPERLQDAATPTAFPLGYVAINGVATLIGGQGQPAYQLTYWQAIPALSASNTVNWLVSREPGLYLYAALLEASPYIQDDDRAQVWAQQYQSILAGMQAEDASARYGNGATIRVRGMP